MVSAAARVDATFVHRFLSSGVEFAADVLPQRNTVAMLFRMLTGVADDPLELTGVGSIIERTLSKGTQRFEGRALADAFDALGAQWGTSTGRQSTLVQVVCLPEYAEQVSDLVAELLCRPTFPDEACRVAVQLAKENLKHLEDDPGDLLRVQIQRLTLGPIYGRYVGGEPEALARITPERVRSEWERRYCAGRLQVAAAGAVNADRLAARIDRAFEGFGDFAASGREPANIRFTPNKLHRHKDIKQDHIAITIPGLARTDGEFAVEQVLLGVLSGGMSGRLFTEVREKQGLVYSVAAWHEQPRGCGFMYMSASTTPERCEATYATLLREIERVSQDLTEAEVERAKKQLIAHALTEDDLTRARAAALSDDLFHYSRPVGLEPKLDAVRSVTLQQVEAYAQELPTRPRCVATLGPRPL